MNGDMIQFASGHCLIDPTGLTIGASLDAPIEQLPPCACTELIIAWALDVLSPTGQYILN